MKRSLGKRPPAQPLYTGTMDPASRRQIARWLREQIKKLEAHREKAFRETIERLEDAVRQLEEGI